MQKRIMLMSAVVVTLLSSCVKDSISEPDFNTDSNGVTFTASMELATKTTLDTETGEVAWAVGDVVKFDYEIGQEDCEPVVSQPLTAEDIVDGIARFTVDVPEAYKSDPEKAFSEGGYKVVAEYTSPGGKVFTYESNQVQSTKKTHIWGDYYYTYEHYYNGFEY